MAIDSVVTDPRLEDQFAGDEGFRGDQATKGTLQAPPGRESTPKEGSKRRGDSWAPRPRTCVPRRASVCPRCRRSHGATSRGQTPRPPHSPLQPHGARGGCEVLVSGPAHRCLSRSRPFHSNPRASAPPQRPPRPRPSRSTGSAGLPALAEVLVSWGAGGVPRTPRRRVAKPRASPSKETATPGGWSRSPALPSASPA